FALNLRCVSKHDEIVNDQEVSFFVKGATHVYAYSINENDERVAVTMWPGTSITNFNTADNAYMNYRYFGKTPADKLYLIFNYKAENGQVYSISKSGSYAIITTEETPASLTGWLAKGDTAPNNSGNSSHKTDVNNGNNRYYWNISHLVEGDVTLTTSPQAIQISTDYTYRIHGNIFTGSWGAANSSEGKGELTKQADGTWSGTFTVNKEGGEFGIQRMLGTGQNAFFKRPSGKGYIQIGVPELCGTDGDNFQINKGEYTFTYNPTTQYLTVTTGSTPPTPPTPVTTTYVLYTPGDANNWNHGESIRLTSTDGKNFKGVAYLKSIFKFTDKPNFNDDGITNVYGDGGSNKLSTNRSAGNLTVGEEGLYWVTVNTQNLSYSLQKIGNGAFVLPSGDETKLRWVKLENSTLKYTTINKLSVVGNEGDWGKDAELTPNSTYDVWSGNVTFGDGKEWKIRANGGWDHSWGGSINNIVYNGLNLPAQTAGTHNVKFDFSSIPYKVTL
ncbi:MAG: hypothetical protein K2H15_07390, partial [Muribaculaceae bacterium]|nr:hypothetical protein [Muribaculaceae bacterium]